MQGAALIVSADPEGESAQTLFAKALGTRLQEDPQIAQELLHLLGGAKAVQEVLVDRDSWVEDVTQQMKGIGTQSAKATNNSSIKGIKQIRD